MPELALVREPADRHEFAEAMSTVASSVVVVTCSLDGRPWGMTVTAFASVSVDPPTVLVSLGSGSAAAHAIAETGRFGISVLDAEQAHVARFASRPGAAKFLEPFVDEELGGSPVVFGAHVDLGCELSEAVEVADHTVFFGRVLAARTAPAGTPLLYHRRGYRAVSEQSAERSVRCLAS